MDFNLSKRYCYYFNEICKIPHGSCNEKQLSDWLVQFAKDHNLDYVQDDLWNIVIYKKASVGHEDHKGVIIQAHMDMICESVPGYIHDFKRDPLDLYVDGDYLRARGTTLGADDGMGCAYMLAILDNDTLEHPFLECCFTTQEEVGLVGAQSLKPEYFKARQLINLDGAGEVKTYMSMGGGQQANVKLPVTREDNNKKTYSLSIEGLIGGHSGGMIDKERANANKLMARVLQNFMAAGLTFGLAELQGGTKHNVIANGAKAVFATDAKLQQLQEILVACQKAISEEYEFSDPNIKITLCGVDTAVTVVPEWESKGVVELAYLLPNGLKARNVTVEDNPPVTSVNLGIVALKENQVEYCLSARSSMDSAIADLNCQIFLTAELFGATVITDSYYPGWKYDTVSPLREKLKEVYYNIYHKDLLCLIGHGGNECGVFKKMYPHMDIVTSGAIYGKIHTTDEFLDLASFDRAYILLTTFLKNL